MFSNSSLKRTSDCTSKSRYDPHCKSKPKLILFSKNQFYVSSWYKIDGIENIITEDITRNTINDFHKG